MKLGIGAVQFGINYGISNIYGRTAKDESLEIFDTAQKNGINVIDTAASYGCSEKVIGSFPMSNNWRVVTKTPNFKDPSIDFSHVEHLNKSFYQSLLNLKKDKVYGLLLHSCKDLMKPGGDLLMQEMERLKSVGLVDKIGVSVYNSEHIEFILDGFNVDLIQLPINIFDQSLYLDGWLHKLKNNNIEIHARSVFLQGLLLMSMGSIPSYFSPIKNKITMFSESAKELSLSRLELALGYVMCIQEIDHVLVGVNTADQLQEIIKATTIKINPQDFLENSIKNPAYVNPALWKI